MENITLELKKDLNELKDRKKIRKEIEELCNETINISGRRSTFHGKLKPRILHAF